jgi:hypothetical protein
MTAEELLRAGVDRLAVFCAANGIEQPELRVTRGSDPWRVSACAYYRPTYIAICPRLCSRPGFAGRSWSWPGYSADRTPFGVLAHELGHHVDYSTGQRRQSYSSEFSSAVRDGSREAPLTSYCPNDAEWFAEMFRLFVTNAALLRVLRPRTHGVLADRFTAVTHPTDWAVELRSAPQRYFDAVEKKLTERSRSRRAADVGARLI